MRAKPETSDAGSRAPGRRSSGQVGCVCQAHRCENTWTNTWTCPGQNETGFWAGMQSPDEDHGQGLHFLQFGPTAREASWPSSGSPCAAAATLSEP